MKQTFTQVKLVAAALLFPVLLSAQEEAAAPRWSIGPSIGYESFEYRTAPDGAMDESISELSEPTVAMSLLFDASNHFAIQGRAGLQKSKFTTSRMFTSPEIGVGTRRWNYVNKTFTVETSLRYSIFSTRSGPFLEAGFRGGLPVKSRIRQTFTADKETVTERNEELTGFDYGLAVGAGYRIGAFELRLQGSVNDRTGFEGTFKHRQLGAQATYRFAMRPLH